MKRITTTAMTNDTIRSRVQWIVLETMLRESGRDPADSAPVIRSAFSDIYRRLTNILILQQTGLPKETNQPGEWLQIQAHLYLTAGGVPRQKFDYRRSARSSFSAQNQSSSGDPFWNPRVS